MTVADLVDHICTSTGYSDTDDQAACRKFILARDRMIFDGSLWKDSLVMVPIALDPTNNLDHAAGFVLCPEVVDNVVAVRTTANAVRINALEFYYGFDLDRFADMGNPFEFSILSPIWFTVRPAANPWVSQPTVNQTFHRELNCSVGDVFKFVNDTGELINVSTPGLSNVFGRVAAGDTFYFSAPTTQVWFNYTTSPFNPINVYKRTLVPYQSTGPGASLVITSGAGDTGNIKVIWRDQAGKRYTTVAALPSVTLTPDDGAGYFEIEAIFKPVTTSDLTLTLTDITGVPVSLATLSKTATRSPSFQRLRLFGIPNTAVTMNILGKGKYLPLDMDSQEIFLRNSENVLIAFVRGDLLRRGGENGAAAAAYTEAEALLSALRDGETVQSANNVRITPDDGFGPNWELGPYTWPGGGW